MSLLQMMFSIVFLGGYVLVVQDLFASDESNLIRTVFFVDIFLIVALLLFRRAIKGLQRMSDSLASILAKRPDAAPTSITRSTPTSGRDIALMAAQGRQIYRGGKRPEEHTSELQALMRIAYSVLCIVRKKEIS